jgi:oligopeptide transport system substrate-binding protein
VNILRHLKSGSVRGILPLLLLSVCVLNACGPETPLSVRATVLNRGTGDEPESLDMQKASSTGAGDVQRDIGEGLLGFTPNGELRAAAAERWTISEDGREYTFWLRPQARWSNGDPVTAEDFVYSFRRLVDPATAALYVKSVDSVANASEIISGQLMPDSLGISAVGNYELQIRLKQAVPYFLSLLTHPSTFPVHRGSVEQQGDAHARAGNLVSNGAYKLVDWQLGSHIELVRNEFYWNSAETAIERVMHYVSPEPMSELNRFRAGELDVTHTIPPESFRQMQQQRPDEVHISPALGVYYYGFNMTKPDLANNPKLREALSMAIDRETIAYEIVGRGEPPAYGWVPDGIANYHPRRFSYAILTKEERHHKARQIFQEAGYGVNNPLTIELRYNTSNIHQRIAASVQAMWKDVLGVETTLIQEEFQVLLENIQQKAVTEVFRLTWSGDYNDAHTFLSMFESNNPSNLTGYKSTEFDSMMQRAAAQTEPELRNRFLEEAEGVLLRGHPVIPLYFYVNKSMVSKRVKGWGDNVLNYHYSQHLSLTTEE